MSINKRNKE